jgi:hypothetical protein
MFRKSLSTARFLVDRYRHGFDVPDQPQFDDDGRAYFLDRLTKASFYLEYGSGGSTVAAASLRKPFITVDSDRVYLESVRRKIAHIGITTAWGYPLLKTETPGRLVRWRNYAELPWTYNIRPDLILIDGRFRVHCALYSISRLDDFEILFDDYASRPHYREVEKFAELEMRGRLAVLKPKHFDRTELLSSIKRFSRDYR